MISKRKPNKKYTPDFILEMIRLKDEPETCAYDGLVMQF
jgi:hypothetical protein